MHRRVPGPTVAGGNMRHDALPNRLRCGRVDPVDTMCRLVRWRCADALPQHATPRRIRWQGMPRLHRATSLCDPSVPCGLSYVNLGRLCGMQRKVRCWHSDPGTFRAAICTEWRRRLPSAHRLAFVQHSTVLNRLQARSLDQVVAMHKVLRPGHQAPLAKCRAHGRLRRQTVRCHCILCGVQHGDVRRRLQAFRLYSVGFVLAHVRQRYPNS